MAQSSTAIRSAQRDTPFLWEGKDDMVYAGNLALKGVAPLGATSFLAEVAECEQEIRGFAE